MGFCGECGKEIKENEDHNCGIKASILSDLKNIGVSFSRTIKFFGRISEKWKKLPVILRQSALVISLFLLGDRFPWKTVFGNEMGGYVQAAMILGGIFLLLKMLKTIDEMRGKTGKTPHGGHTN